MNDDDINVLALVKGKERYIFLFDDSKRAETLRMFGRYASNPDLSFTWYDAAVLSQKLRQATQKESQPRRFELPQPAQSEGDVLDFVVVNDAHERGAAFVADVQKVFFEFERVIEIADLKGQRQACEVIENALECLGLFPDVTVDRQVAEVETKGGGSFGVGESSATGGAPPSIRSRSSSRPFT